MTAKATSAKKSRETVQGNYYLDRKREHKHAQLRLEICTKNRI